MLDRVLHDPSARRRSRRGLARRQRRHREAIRKLGELRLVLLHLLLWLRDRRIWRRLGLAGTALFLPRHLDALRCIAARVRQRIGRVRRLLRRTGGAVLIREFAPQRRPRCRSIDARLHEYEARRFGHTLLREEQRTGARGARVRKKSGSNEDDDDREQVKNERDQHPLTRRDGVPDGREFRVVILEIEIHQEVT